MSTDEMDDFIPTNTHRQDAIPQCIRDLLGNDLIVVFDAREVPTTTLTDGTPHDRR